MILYHAISSFHILQCILHHINYTSDEDAVLILPDFIINKYPRYKNLEKLGLFSKVKLLKYMYIPHNKSTVISDVSYRYKKDIKYPIEHFDDVYCAGAHFYFSLYLISNNIHFTAFEDACGMLSRAEEMYKTLYNKFPIHAEIANKYKLFSLENSYIKNILCYKNSQKIDVSSDKYINFDSVKELKKLDVNTLNRIISFFIKKKYHAEINDVILLTQHFANLGNMTNEKQEAIYDFILNNKLKNCHVIIKPHPDDTLDYSKKYHNVMVIKEKFPSELLPFVFDHRPQKIVTVSSTGIRLLEKDFKIEEYKDIEEMLKKDPEVNI